jgi:hypothetical protein
MKSAKFWAGLALTMLLCCASFAFGEGTTHSQSLYVGSSLNLSPSLLVFAFAPGSSFHPAKPANSSNGWGGGGGGWGGGCGNGGGKGGGWNGSGGGGGGGWGGGGGGGNGGCVPEGGNSLEYLALGAFACIGAIAYRTRRQNAVCGTK